MYRLKLHLMPPEGWMNDPNGMCYYKGKYHVFFQYAPSGPMGVERYWGHYTSDNLVRWKYEGIAVKSDTPWDRDGAYSGCGFTDDGQMEIYYTGNVMEPGDYDYTHAGRGANVITAVSANGYETGPKKLLLTNADYPDYYTNHVRDPQVWKKNNKYYMILGGRKNNDTGAIITYESQDKIHWEWTGDVVSKGPFGYMWECPGTFTLDGHTVLTFCPQGTERRDTAFQNMYHSGYVILDDREPENLAGTIDEQSFREWDYGFDFYAPQTMQAPDGRRLIMGWAGVPGMEEEYNNAPTIEEGWQHSMTLMRELALDNGIIRQYPVKEFDTLRYEEHRLTDGVTVINNDIWDCEISVNEGTPFLIELNSQVRMQWDAGVFELSFLTDCAGGRTTRRVKIDSVNHIRIIKDVSMFEIYLNHGAAVMTSRYFEHCGETVLKVCGAAGGAYWKLRPMDMEGTDIE